ncbi:MAG: YbhB/YbcL family Raf kinase inhibitor-like protein [Proteobacteria bacterium]|nr:YbhB/YbcL family Raf kinase inhibitor-like protein [Pseudomonadota bacterium]
MLRFPKSVIRRLIFGSILVSAAASAQMSITSSAFTNGNPIPDPFQYNQGPPGQCTGGNNWSPPLAITGIPAGTNTLAIELNDITNPWLHWEAWGIPVSGTSVSLPYNYASTMPTGTQATNSFGTYGYGGPCAPPDGRTHQYVFTAYALTITGTTQPTTAQLNAAPQATLTGTRVYGETVPWSPTTPVVLQSFDVN